MTKHLIHLMASPPFDFYATVYSHGWVGLAPNRWDPASKTLSRIEELGSGKVVEVQISGGTSGENPGIQIAVEGRGRLKHSEEQALTARVRRMLRLDEDFSEFYALCRKQGMPWDRLTSGHGRLLRSPTLFEDILKTICTTNIQWGGTVKMVSNLVSALGKPFPGDPSRKAFPSPTAIAQASPDLLSQARLGYRGAYVQELAEQVAGGHLDLEAFEAPGLSTEKLKKMLVAIKGVGNYAANTLLMLLGRYEYLAFDTVMRDFLASRYLGDRQPTEDEALAIYESWGKWKFLAYWFDMISDIDLEDL